MSGNFDYWAEQVQQLVGDDIDENWLMACYQKNWSVEETADRIYEAWANSIEVTDAA